MEMMKFYLDLAGIEEAKKLFQGEDLYKLRPTFASKTQMSSLPPTVVVTAGFDPLRDEALMYLERIRACDVRTHHFHFPGQIHGFCFDFAKNNTKCIAALTDVCSEIRRRFLEVDLEDFLD
jgi:acetyl esterase/lipase